MGERQGQECVFALDLDGGKELWCTPIGKTADNAGYPGPRCTPTADGKLVYAIGSHGDLACYDAATGRGEMAQKSADRFRRQNDVDLGLQRIASGGRRQIGLHPRRQQAVMVALNKQTGEEIWRCALPDIGKKGKEGAGYSSIVISHGGGKKQYVQFVGRGLIGVDPASGKLLWGYNKIANEVANISTPVVHDDGVFVIRGVWIGCGKGATRGGKSTAACALTRCTSSTRRIFKTIMEESCWSAIICTAATASKTDFQPASIGKPAASFGAASSAGPAQARPR